MYKKQLLYDIFQAYYDARKNKRNTINALKFEINYEIELLKLYEEIINKTYEIKSSICFVNFSPVQREIFAADFRDRILHHLIYNYISPYFEKIFINDSYSCRKDKGTHYGIKRLNHFIRSCSNNYKNDCYILKLDIKGYFMAINKNILFSQVKNTLSQYCFVDPTGQAIEKYNKSINFDIDLILWLIKKIIFNDSTKNCQIKGGKEDWKGLPKDKSLFFANNNCGLPIGNLTSQLFGNVYLNDFDHFIKNNLCVKYYGRYVDDFVILHQDREYLKSLIPVLTEYLQTNLSLTLHPKKIYLQHYTKGVKFLGTVIKPYRIYTGNRTKGNFYDTIQYWNKIIRQNKLHILNKEQEREFLSSINSYLGIMKHYNTYKLRKKMLLENLSAYFYNYFYITNNYSKLAPKIKIL